MLLVVDPLEVRHIDVVAVTPDRDANWHRWSTLPGEVIGTWSGDSVRVALGLVAALPESEQRRCFTPRYGMRMRTELIVLAEVALCFTCHNAPYRTKPFRGHLTGASPVEPAWRP